MSGFRTATRIRQRALAGRQHAAACAAVCLGCNADTEMSSGTQAAVCMRQERGHGVQPRSRQQASGWSMTVSALHCGTSCCNSI